MRVLADELGRLQDPVELLEVAQVEGDDGAGAEDRLVAVQLVRIRVRHRKGPGKAGKMRKNMVKKLRLQFSKFFCGKPTHEAFQMGHFS